MAQAVADRIILNMWYMYGFGRKSFPSLSPRLQGVLVQYTQETVCQSPELWIISHGKLANLPARLILKGLLAVYKIRNSLLSELKEMMNVYFFQCLCWRVHCIVSSPATCMGPVLTHTLKCVCFVFLSQRIVPIWSLISLRRLSLFLMWRDCWELAVNNCCVFH